MSFAYSSSGSRTAIALAEMPKSTLDENYLLSEFCARNFLLTCGSYKHFSGAMPCSEVLETLYATGKYGEKGPNGEHSERMYGVMRALESLCERTKQ